MTMWFGNYLNIRRKLPGMKKINVLSTILTLGCAFTICNYKKTGHMLRQFNIMSCLFCAVSTQITVMIMILSLI